MPINIKYTCPFWGQEHLDADAFIDKVVENNFQGIEIHLPATEKFTNSFIDGIEDVYEINPEFVFVLQQHTVPCNENLGSYIKRMEEKFFELAAYQPTFINSHTGTDYFSFDDNCRVLEACLNIGNKIGVKILHETHRGRFSFHAASLVSYLEKFPELELTGDFSHFCTVSESLLFNQEDIMEKIIPHVLYIHARVGHEQGAQINDPFAPEWENHLKRFTTWWDEIIKQNHDKGKKEFVICPEFGPAPYMPCMPYTRQPLANQWDINVKMKEYLKAHFKDIIA